MKRIWECRFNCASYFLSSSPLLYMELKNGFSVSLESRQHAMREVSFSHWKQDNSCKKCVYNQVSLMCCIPKISSPSSFLPSDRHSRAGRCTRLDQLPLLCSISNSPPGEHHYPLCDQDWTQPPPTHVLLPGHVGLHWPWPVHRHHPQDVRHFLVQSQGHCIWCLHHTNVHCPSMHWPGVCGAASHGHRSLYCHLQPPEIQHDPYQQGDSHPRYSQHSQDFGVCDSIHISHLKVAFLWSADYPPHLLWTHGLSKMACASIRSMLYMAWLLSQWDTLTFLGLGFLMSKSAEQSSTSHPGTPGSRLWVHVAPTLCHVSFPPASPLLLHDTPIWSQHPSLHPHTSGQSVRDCSPCS